MVTWRSAQLVILTILFMALILVLGTAQLLNFSPRVHITVPATSPFLPDAAPTNAHTALPEREAAVGTGNCIMNDGSIISLLPNCVIGDDGQVRPGQE